jgi:ribosomal protein S18 acetylase RimI-like enzyme
VFGRFSDRARHVVVLAQEEARLLNHDHIGTEHLLLGLVAEDEGVAAQALASLHISLEASRREVGRIIGEGSTAPTGHIPFTPRSKKVLELSLRAARELGRDSIDTEHILLGLVRERAGAGAQVLRGFGATEDRVHERVLAILSGHPSTSPVQVRLRPMTDVEFDAWMDWAIEDYAREDAAAHHIAVDVERSRTEIAALLPDGLDTHGHRFRIAESAGERVGLLWFGSKETEAGTVCWLYDLWVEEPMRKRGYGRALMRALEAETRDMGLSRIELKVSGFNDRARALYESLGFVEIERRMYKVLPEA